MNAQLAMPGVKAFLTQTHEAWWQRAADLFVRGEQPVAQLADHIQRDPVLQDWLLAAAGQPAAVRHQVLAQIAERLAAARPNPAREWVFDSMTDEIVHEAVVEELFRRGGFAPQRDGGRRGLAGRGQPVSVARPTELAPAF